MTTIRTRRRATAVLAVLAIAAVGLLALVTSSSAAPRAQNGRIAFVADVAGKPQVFTIEPDGTGSTQVTRHPTGAGEYGIAWVKGSSLLFTTGTDPNLIYRVAATGGVARRVSPKCTGTCLGDNFPAVTRSGSKLAFERAFGPIVADNAASVGLFTMNAAGGGLKQITQRKQSGTEDHKPTWSPDGKRLAFWRLDLSMSVGAIFVVNADGTHLRRLTPYAMDAGNPKWSPDGTRILFNDHEESAVSVNLFTMRPDGTGLRKLTRYTGMSQAYVDDWSPDGTQIIFHFVSGAVNQLYLINADGSGAHPLTKLPAGTNPRVAVWGTLG